MARPGVYGHLHLGWVWIPHPGQVPLLTSYGEHRGFPYRHQASFYLSHTPKGSPWRVGVAARMERYGWASEDFLISPSQGAFDLGSYLNSGGVFLVRPSANFRWGLGTHAQPDAWYPWMLSSFGPLGFSVTAREDRWEYLRFWLELESRELWGGEPKSLWRYAPDLAFSIDRHARDPWILHWRQNLYKQHFYVETSLRARERQEKEILFLFYPDPGHLISLEGGLRSFAGGGWMWGGALQVPLFRISYSHPRDYDRFMQIRGLWLMEFVLDLGSVRNQHFFGRNAPRPSPLEDELPKPRRKK